MALKSPVSRIGLIALATLTAVCLTQTGCGNSIPYEDLLIAYEPDSSIDPSREYIAILGDIQAYTSVSVNNGYLMRTLAWLDGQQKHYGNIRCLLQTGDVTDQNSDHEWEVFRNDFEKITEKITTVVTTGNHDYTFESAVPPRLTSRLDDYYSSPRLEECIEHRYDKGSLANIIVRNTVHGERYDIISLEFAPRPEVVAWADSVVSANPAVHYFLMTHEFLWHGKQVNYGESFAYIMFHDSKTAYAPDQVWEKLVYNNDNIVAVLCGHNGFSEFLETANCTGRMVPQIMFNLQYQEHGGDSLVELWEFPENNDTAYVKVYNTWHRQFLDTPETNYKFRYRS